MGKVQKGVRKSRVSEVGSKAPTMMDMGRSMRAVVRDDFPSTVDWVESRGKEEKITLSDEETKGSAIDKKPESKQVVEGMLVDTVAQEEAADHVKAARNENEKVATARKKLEEERAKLLVKETELANLLRLHSLFGEAITSCDQKPPVITESTENAIPKVSNVPESATKNGVEQATTRQEYLTQRRSNCLRQGVQEKGTKVSENKSIIDLSVREDNDGKFVICDNRQKVTNAESLRQLQPVKSCNCNGYCGCDGDVKVKADESTKSHHNVWVVTSQPVEKKPMVLNDTNAAENQAKFENPVVADIENIDEKVCEIKAFLKNNDAKIFTIIAMNEGDDGKESDRSKCKQSISVEQQKDKVDVARKIKRKLIDGDGRFMSKQSKIKTDKRRDAETNDGSQGIEGKNAVPLSKRELIKTSYLKVDGMKKFPITNNVGYSFLTNDVIRKCWVTEHLNDCNDDCRRQHYCHVAIVRRVHLKGGKWSQVGVKKRGHRKRMKKRRKKIERKSRCQLIVTKGSNVMKIEGRRESNKHLHQERKEIRVGSTLIEEGRYVMKIKGRQLFKPNKAPLYGNRKQSSPPIRMYID
jgi:hypothetical protein